MPQTSNSNTIKFLFSYGGKIIPRPTDGKLRYIGGHTRVLSVDRTITFSELMVKFGETCGCSMDLKCKLPNEDLDVLVSIKSDEDLQNVIQVYEKSENKIRAVLFPSKSGKKVAVNSCPTSPLSRFDMASPNYKRVCYVASPRAYRCDPPVCGLRFVAARHRCCERSLVQYQHTRLWSRCY